MTDDPARRDTRPDLSCRHGGYALVRPEQMKCPWPEDLWRRNSLDYWEKVHAGIDPIVIPMSWMALPEHMRS